MKNRLISMMASLGVIVMMPLHSVASESATADGVVTDKMYPKPPVEPNYGPAYGSIKFRDRDPRETIGGELRMMRAVDEEGNRVDEKAEGITTYMVHWGLIVGEEGTADDKGAGDHGGDCRGFRDTGHVVMANVDDLDDSDVITWNIPLGTEVPEGAVYFVGHTIYGQIHNLGKCTQLAIDNQVER